MCARCEFVQKSYNHFDVLHTFLWISRVHVHVHNHCIFRAPFANVACSTRRDVVYMYESKTLHRPITLLLQWHSPVRVASYNWCPTYRTVNIVECPVIHQAALRPTPTNLQRNAFHGDCASNLVSLAFRRQCYLLIS